MHRPKQAEQWCVYRYGQQCIERRIPRMAPLRGEEAPSDGSSDASHENNAGVGQGGQKGDGDSLSLAEAHWAMSPMLGFEDGVRRFSTAIRQLPTRQSRAIGSLKPTTA